MPGAPEPEIRSTTWRALGASVDLLVLDGDLEAAQGAVEAVLADVDRTYSRFRPDSELMDVNRRAGETVALSPLLATAIGAAIGAARATDGLCDPTIGRALNRIGYDDDFAVIATRDVGRAAPIRLRIERVPGWRTLAFDADAATIRAPQGVEIDLGSTGKALAADLAAAAALEAMGGAEAGVLVSLGGDIAIAGAVPPGGWAIRVTHDSTTPPDADVPGEDTDVIAIREGAVATSSTTVRWWRRGTITVHHLIDPRTGLPARSPWQTVSVVAATCVDANAAATAALIRGDDAPAWLESLGLAARFAAADGSVIRVGGWPEPLTNEAPTVPA
jgi:thiamine biosynthesis lipoprotein